MRVPTCITSTTVKTAVIAISAISATAIPMIFRLIDNLIMIDHPPDSARCAVMSNGVATKSARALS